MIVSVRHIGLVALDLKHMTSFYESLGFTPFLHLEESGPFIDQVVGFAGTSLLSTKMSNADGFILDCFITFVLIFI